MEQEAKKIINCNTVEGLKEAFEYVTFLEMNNGLYLYSTLEVYDMINSRSRQMASLEEVIAVYGDQLEGITVNLY